MNLYCWECPYVESESFYVLSTSFDDAFKSVKEYIEKNKDDCNIIWDFPNDFEFSEKEVNEVFTVYNGY